MKMSENDSVANANGQGPVTIIEHEGEEYVLAPLLMEDLGKIEMFVKKQHRADILAVIREAGDLLSPKEKQQWLRELAGDSVAQDEESEDAEAIIKWTWMDEMVSPSVINFTLTLRLRKTYPQMKQEQANSIISAKAIADMTEEMTSLLGLDAFISDEDGEATAGEAPSA
jgi:hypothetical protein